MQSKYSWISEKVFGKDSEPLVTVSYQSHRDALEHLQAALQEHNGLGVLQGGEGTGKTSTVRHLQEITPVGTTIAFISGVKIKASDMMSQMLTQFGYDTGLEAVEELEKMIRVFATQQAHSGRTPILIVDDIDQMYPSALRSLNNLAALEVDGRYAIRMILTGRDGIATLVASEGMPDVRKRDEGHFQMGPMSIKESLIYIYKRLEACGINDAETIFPVDVCDFLFEQSGGWPGALNEEAVQAMQSATSFPLKLSDTIIQHGASLRAVKDLPVLDAEKAVGPIAPSLIVTKNDSNVFEYTFKENRVLIGRSDFADVVIEDHFVSKMHAVLLRFADALVFLDLNSANGSSVNSAVTKSTILKSDDIISLGNHRLKVRNAPAISDEMAKLRQSPDTLKMKTLVAMRRKRKQRLALIKTQSASTN